LTSNGENRLELLFEWDAKTDQWPLLSERLLSQEGGKNRGITVDEAKA